MKIVNQCNAVLGKVVSSDIYPSINRHLGEGLGVRAGQGVHDDVGARQGHHARDVRAQYRQARDKHFLSHYPPLISLLVV